MRPPSGIPKNVREANLRRERNKARRFNEPLIIFLQRKYPNVLQEFSQLFKWIEQRNPSRKNLSIINTADFKEWMLNNPFPEPPTPTRIPISPLHQTTSKPPESSIQNEDVLDLSPQLIPLQPLLEIPLHHTTSKPPESSIQNEDVLDLSPQLIPLQPLLEIPLLPSPQVQNENILELACREIEEPVSLEDIPEAIVNELMEDNFLRELLNSIPEELPELRGLLYEDEGIELNPFDEIVEELEPFDFAECELF